MICVNHPSVEAVEVCIWPQRYGNGGTVKDFCGDCIEHGADEDNFGRCYECDDGLHERCIGVPCQCECPPTDVDRLREEIVSTELLLARLRARLNQAEASS